MTLRRSLLFALFVVAFVDSTTGAAKAATEQRTISLNLKRVQIGDLVKKVGEATHRTILFDDQVRGTLSIVAKRPVDLDEAWSILDVSLSLLGFAMLPSTEGTWRIARVATAVGEAPFHETISGSSDRFVTTLIPLRVAKPQDVLAVLEPLAGSRVTLVPFDRTNSLIASGPERAIARLTSIADELDRVEKRDLRHRVLRYREVGEMEGWIEGLFDSGKLSARDLEVWSDARTNSFIYRGSEAQVVYFANLLDRLDKPIEGGGKVSVLKVLNRDPEEVAELIRSLSGSGSSAGSAVAGDAGEQTTTILEESDYAIAVDATTRSLVVRAEPQVRDAIREVLDILDVPPQLIAVDIKFTQVVTPSAFSLGFGFNLPLSPGDDTDEVIARLVSNPGGAGLLAQPTEQTPLFGRVSRDAGLPFVVGEGGVEIPITDTAVIDAGEFHARTDVLIEPSLVITAGDRHEIFVGDNYPVPVGDGTAVTDTLNDSGSNLSQRTIIERYDVGTRLGIEATAGPVGKIQLVLDIELSQLAPSLVGSIEAVGPTFLERKVLVTAHLDDGEIATVALDEEVQTVDGQAGTPFLSDIPFLGVFFRRRVERQEDVRLVITAQARRLGSPAEVVADSIRRRLAFERRNARDAKMPTAATTGSQFAVLVTTRSLEEDARVISQGLVRQGFSSDVYPWSIGGEELFDVYVTSLESMADAADVAERLSAEGWEADLIVLPTRSS